jgi:antirestriction protein ArdC
MDNKLEKFQATLLAKANEAYEKGIDWRKPWSGKGLFPLNPVSGHEYTGTNFWFLSLAGTYGMPLFSTFNQIKQSNGSVIAGSKGFPILRPIFRDVFMEKDVNGKKEKVKVKKLIGFADYTVFHLPTQTTGMEAVLAKYEPKKVSEFTAIEACEKIVAGFKNAPVVAFGGYKACYVPSLDSIQMPLATSFKEPSAYYQTLFHEFLHSTAHGTRCKRDMGSYGLEELVAETGASILCALAGIENQVLDSSASYLAGWMKKINENPKILMDTYKEAFKAAKYIYPEGLTSL